MSEHALGKPGVRCSGCGLVYPNDRFHYRCPQCASLFELSQPLPYAPRQKTTTVGLERFRQSFPIPETAAFSSLGEGDTPLVSIPFMGRDVYLKCEHSNPTGSFKDRGTVVLINTIKEMGILEVVEDSSGNAGASLAAYAAASGIHARIYIPAYASGPKRMQIEAYGAEVVPVPGTRADVSQAVYDEAEGGYAYASHAYLPHGLAGMATIAFELFEQLGTAPGAILAPVGQGTLLLGLAYGFRSLNVAGYLKTVPRLVGVQAASCAPMWQAFHTGQIQMSPSDERTTLAEGIRIIQPLRGKQVIQEIRSTGGEVLKVEESAILQGRNELGRQGIYVEPTSAVVWDGLKQTIDRLPDPVVAILTGNGFKAADKS